MTLQIMNASKIVFSIHLIPLNAIFGAAIFVIYLFRRFTTLFLFPKSLFNLAYKRFISISYNGYFHLNQSCYPLPSEIILISELPFRSCS